MKVRALFRYRVVWVLLIGGTLLLIDWLATR